MRQVAQPVSKINEQIQRLVDRMIDVMIASCGIGLAAPQVGVGLRIVVMSLTGRKEDAEAFINPQLGDFHGSSETEEGCLSVPGIRAKVRRSAVCTLKAQDIDGNNIVMDMVDLAATCIQHETDHLDGTIFLDRLSPISRLACRKAIRELEQQYEKE